MEVSAARSPIPLRQKTFAVFVYLLRHRDRVVSRKELLEEVWPGTVVTENSVAQCINELRNVLGDDAREPVFIRTVGRSGYRFVAAVEEVPEEEPVSVSAVPEPGATTAVARPARVPRLAWVAAAVALFGAGLTIRVSAGGNAAGPSLASEASALSLTSNIRAARAYASGVELSRQYHVKEAVDQFEEALRLDPGFTMARARLGYVYSVRWLAEDRGKPYLEAAYAARDRLNDLNRLYILAWYDQANHDYEGTIRDLRELTTRFPRETEAREELGRVLLGENRFQEAGLQLEEAARTEPASPQVHNFLCALFMATHQFSRAIEEANRMVNLSPGEVNSQDTLGMAYEAAGDFEQAERTYRQILTQQPKFEVARIHLGNALYRMGRWREAQAELERYIADAPSDAERQWGAEELATIALARGDATEVLRLGGSEPPDGYHDQEILLALQQGDLSKADRLLATRVEHADRGQHANQRFVLTVRGERALAAHDPATAIDLLKKAVAERTPLYATEWYEDSLADAYLRLGRYGEAIAEYRRILAIYPRLASAWRGLATAYRATHQDNLARSAREEMLKIWCNADPDLPLLAKVAGSSEAR